MPEGATGAIVEVVNTGGISTYSGVLRGKEDTRDYMSNLAFEEIEAETHRWQIVKVDSNRMIQGYIENTAIDFKLLGYTVGSDPSYFTVPPDITPVSSNQWTTVDVSNLVDSDADGVVLFVDSISGSDRDFGIQEVGAQQTTANEELEEYGNTMWLVGLSDSKHFVARLEDTNVKIYLVAQTKGSVVYYVTDMSVTNPPTGFWQTMDADDYGVLAAANGLIFRAFNSSGDPDDDYKIGLRHGDSTDDWNGDIGGGKPTSRRPLASITASSGTCSYRAMLSMYGLPATRGWSGWTSTPTSTCSSGMPATMSRPRWTSTWRSPATSRIQIGRPLPSPMPSPATPWSTRPTTWR